MHPVPPLAPHSLLVYLAAIAVLLAVARLLGRLAARIGMPAIVGELATGVILGPSLLLHVLPGALHWLFPADANQMHLLDGIALAGLRLGVLNTTTYTIVVLVALVTSIMAPPVLRHSMSRITQTHEELVRQIDHDTWDRDERVQHAA